MKKVFSIIKTVFTWLLVVAAVGMMIFTVVSVNTFDKTDRDIFGYKAFIVLSDSMSAVNGDKSKGYFDAGDLILVKEVDPKTLKPGDIVSYLSTNAENFGETVTHMIRDYAKDADGNPGFITYGTTTGTNDDNVVTYSYVLGKFQMRVPVVGQFFNFLQTTPGYIICIFIPFLLLIGVQGFNSIRLFKQYQAEKMAEIEAAREKERAEMEAERKRLEEERKRQEEMMQQLLAMQQNMQNSAAPTAPPATTAETESTAPEAPSATTAESENTTPDSSVATTPETESAASAEASTETTDDASKEG